jgi:AAA domain
MTTGGQLAGLPVKAARAVVISEECHLNWRERDRKLHFGSNIGWLCRPFAGKPSKEDWSLLIDGLVQARHRDGLDLVVIDPLVNFLPGHQENSADGLIEVLLMLQRLTSLGVAVLILHHPRKGQVRAGQAARGSGVLGGYADIVLEMRMYSQPADPDRRRVIEGYSRHDETPRRLVIELTADGTDYVSHGDLTEDDFSANGKIVHELLQTAGQPLTRAEIRQRWPPGRTRPDEATIWRWLQRLVGEGTVLQEGRGRRNDPFRFGLVSPITRD